MTRIARLFVALSLAGGCAGSIEVSECDPDVCSGGFLETAPGATHSVDVTFLAEGRYAGAYTVSVVADEGVEASVQPTALELVAGEPQTVTVDTSVVRTL